MTKKVRIENADNSPYNVVVRVFDKVIGVDGEPNQVLVEEHNLKHPTELAEFNIFESRYITISEN